MITDVHIWLQRAVHVTIFYFETWSEIYFFKLNIKVFVLNYHNILTIIGNLEG